MATLLLLAPMGAQAQKSKQKKQVTDVPAIASADSAKIAIDSMLTAQDAANWQASPNQQSLYAKSATGQLGDLIPSVPCGWHLYYLVPDRYTIANIGNCLSSMAVS